MFLQAFLEFTSMNVCPGAAHKLINVLKQTFVGSCRRFNGNYGSFNRKTERAILEAESIELGSCLFTEPSRALSIF